MSEEDPLGEPTAPNQAIPATKPAFLAHVRHWFSQNVAPDIADGRIKAENADTKADTALNLLQDHAASLEQVAGILAKAIAAADPTAAPAIAALTGDAEQAAAEAARIAKAAGGRT